MGNVKFTVIEDYGKLADSGDIYFRLIDWSGYKKFDIRKWDESGDTPYKGVTIDPDELETFYELIVKAKNAKKSTTPKYSVCLGKATANILDIYGGFSENDEMTKQVCFVNWGRSAKYDVRPWNDDYTACGKGVTLSESQLQSLIDIVSEQVLS